MTFADSKGLSGCTSQMIEGHCLDKPRHHSRVSLNHKPPFFGSMAWQLPPYCVQIARNGLVTIVESIKVRCILLWHAQRWSKARAAKHSAYFARLAEAELIAAKHRYFSSSTEFSSLARCSCWNVATSDVPVRFTVIQKRGVLCQGVSDTDLLWGQDEGSSLLLLGMHIVSKIHRLAARPFQRGKQAQPWPELQA